MQNIESLTKTDQEMIARILEKEKSSLVEEELFILKAREFYLTDEEKEKFFGVEKVEVKKVGRKKK